MPHKHTRKEVDLSLFDLPPSQVAKPLPVSLAANKRAAQGKAGKAKASNTSATTGVKRKRNGAQKDDDAPRAFKRLMAFAGGQKFRSGLDDGTTEKKKGKKGKDKKPESAPPAETAAVAAKELPTIKPGERLAEFNARVDAALPLAAARTKGGKDPLGLKKYRTRKEKKMHKLYDDWREEERRIQEKREEELEAAEEKELDDRAAGVYVESQMQEVLSGGKGKKKKGKRTKFLGEAVDKDDEDPWEELRRKRGEAKIGLHDVAQAPPELHKTMSKKLLVRGAAVEVGSVPKAAGSLRRREELEEIRTEFVSSYRTMMDGKRQRQQKQQQ